MTLSVNSSARPFSKTSPARPPRSRPAAWRGLVMMLVVMAAAFALGAAGGSDLNPPAYRPVTANFDSSSAGRSTQTLARNPKSQAYTALDRAGVPGSVSGMLEQPDIADWGLRAAVAVSGLILALIVALRNRPVNRIDSPGFEIITDSEKRQFIPLTQKYQQLDFVTKIKTEGSLRLSANLNKVSLSIRRFGYLMEDRNFRNALLVNRRRVRRTVLKDGDVLDLGDLTLIYRDNRIPPLKRHAPVTPPEGKVSIKFERPRGPVRRGTGVLIWGGQPSRSFYLTQNMMYVGRSEGCDLVIKAKNVEYRHAKIEKVGHRIKLINLSPSGNTYVNNRRVDIRFLKDGDEISFDNHKFKYSILTKPMRERQPQPKFHSQGPRQNDLEESGDEETALEETASQSKSELHQSQSR